MQQKTKNKKTPKPPTLEDILKWEIAQELGLYDVVKEKGFGALTTAQSGKIGGLVATRKRKIQENQN